MATIQNQKVAGGAQAKRKAFQKLKRNLQFAALTPVSSPEPPTKPDPLPVQPVLPAELKATPTPHTPPPTHGTAFSTREPMLCEVCRKMVTKWLSYRPDDKTCVCWDCGIEQQQRIISGMGKK